MRIASVEIKDLLGTRRAQFQPGTLTIISGRNGDGKTSILQALLKLFEGGHDPAILRRGAKIGECVLTLDNSTTIRMRVTGKGTSYEVTDDAGNEIKAPRSYIEQLGDALAVDPLKLLLAKPKDLAATLLEVMPVKFGQAELQETVGEKAWPVNGDMDLEHVELLEKQIYDARTTANRDAKAAKTAISQLKGSLPEKDGYDWAARLKELRELLEDGRRSREAEMSAIDREERESIEEIKAEAQRKMEATRAAAREKRTVLESEWEPQLAKISAAIGEAEGRARDADRAEGIRQMIAAQEKCSVQSQEIADGFSYALERITQLKAEKLSKLPVPGIEVREGQVYADGVPFERVNLAERIKIAFQIAALRAGNLPFMVLDQAEAFDAETWEAFKVGAAASGFQVIAARVSDAPLSIENITAEQVELAHA